VILINSLCCFYLALKDLVDKDSSVKDDLALYLDNEYRVLKNWRHLADKLKAPTKVKDKCKAGTRESPTLVVLRRPDVCKKTIEDLIAILEKLERNDVRVDIVEKKILGK